jgi:integrase/recombinase XerD
MSSHEQVDSVDQADAERTLTIHLASLASRSPSTQSVHRTTITQFLAFVRKSSQSVTGRLVIDDSSLVQWMTHEATHWTARYACQRLGALNHYLRTLTQSGYLSAEPLTTFKARHGNRNWRLIIQALQRIDPVQALAALQIEPPVPGPLKTEVQSYVELHKALGKKYQNHLHVLLHLDTFLQAQGILTAMAVTSDLVEHWIDRMTCGAYTRIHKARFAARFFDHLRSRGVVTDNPVTPTLVSKGRLPPSSFRPYIFTKEQVAAILAEAQALPRTKTFPLRAQTCYTMLALLYALGLRHGELRHLRVRDLDLARQTLFIDQTKFHKCRYIPFGPKIGLCLERFLVVRKDILRPLQQDDALFVTLRRTSLSSHALLDTFRAIIHTLGITGTEGQDGPRLHDIRHTFAVHRLLRWYREGQDVQSKLTYLSTFMGHINPQSTQVYLTITTELLQEANTRFYRCFGSQLDEETRP